MSKRERNPYYGDDDIDLLRSMLDEARAEIVQKDKDIAGSRRDITTLSDENFRLNEEVERLRAPPGADAMEIAEVIVNDAQIYDTGNPLLFDVEKLKSGVARAIEAAVAAERERCAAFCEKLETEYQQRFDRSPNETDYGGKHVAGECSRAIRALGDKP